METVFQKTINGRGIACAFHDAGNKTMVIFCHGYRGSSIGPSRFFVRVARMLAGHGISSLRFDQYGSGNSEGDFIASRFNDWTKTTKSLVLEYSQQGYDVILFGQSMGASTVITTAAGVPQVRATVAWVPDANVEVFEFPESGTIEEGGQVVSAKYWQEAHQASVADRLRDVHSPMYIVQCSDDEYVSSPNHLAIIDNANDNHEVEMFEGYKHSAWSYEQANRIINKSVDFIVANTRKLNKNEH